MDDIPRPDGHGLFWVQDKQTLPHGQPVRLPQAVIARKEPRRERKRPADGIQRITGLYHIDLHTITSQNPMRRAALVFRYFIWYKTSCMGTAKMCRCGA